MFTNDTLRSDTGISVFGSSTIRVVPDLAVVDFAVSRQGETPREAMQAAAEAAASVRSYLASRNLREVTTSGTDLEHRHLRIDGEVVPSGYTARISFSLLLRDSLQPEDVTTALVDAGANVLQSVDRQTSQIKTIRARARDRAVKAAREKAEQYCHSARVSIGRVLCIEDLNPDTLRYSRSGHNVVENQPDDVGDPATNSPGTVLVGAAVRIVYEIGALKSDA